VTLSGPSLRKRDAHSSIHEEGFEYEGKELSMFSFPGRYPTRAPQQYRSRDGYDKSLYGA
jgi:hypothetical protein